MPNDKIMSEIRNKKYLAFMKENQKFVKKQSWSSLIPTAPKSAIDLITNLLTWDPTKRLTAKQVMQHPFLKEIHNPAYIIDGEEINYFDFEFESYTLNKSILRDLILDEIILCYSKEARRAH